MKRIKWHIKEVLKCLSNEPSFYSMKRIMTAVSFAVGIWGMIHWLLVQLLKDTCNISASDMAIWSGVLFGLGGFTVTQILKEKKDDGNA
jgi:hypothetical protein